MVEIINSDPGALLRAADALNNGKLVCFPTETVYGLGADATNDAAVMAIFAAKGRPHFNPLIVHVADLQAAQKLGHFGTLAANMAARFWPGPLTLIVPRRADSGISANATAGLATLAIRVPAHPIAQTLLRASGRPIAAPSANRSGHVSATTPAHVAADLGARIALIVDGGPCPLGLESTVIDVSADAPRILRPGSLSRDELAKQFPQLALDLSRQTGADTKAAESLAPDDESRVPVRVPAAPAPVSPGMLASHYAPKAQLRLNAIDVQAGEALLAFGTPLPVHSGPVINLSPAGNLDEAAAALFSALRQMDAMGVAQIAVMPIPQTGLGLAINDRLTRAAAPRPATI